MTNEQILQKVDEAMKLGRKQALEEVRAEIEQMPSELTADGRRMIRRVSVFRIIDKCRQEG